MKLFYHAHFTGLYKNNSLISIAFVAPNGSYFYAELMDYDKNVDNWIIDHVVSNLKYNDVTEPVVHFIPEISYSAEVIGPKHYVRNAFFYWIQQFEKQKIEWVGDVTHYSFVLLIDLLFDTGLNIPGDKYCIAVMDLNQEIARYMKIDGLDAFDINRAKFLELHGVKIEGKRFNALYDARTVKEIYNIIGGNTDDTSDEKEDRKENL